MSTITRQTAHPSTRPTIEGLRAALPPRLAIALDAALAVVPPGVEVWAVGGAVRDFARGTPVLDLDLATAGDPRPLAEAAARVLDGTVEAHADFGTASALGGAARLDVARLRSETYARPGALPAPVFDANIEDDLRRRDFTVNAVALCLCEGGRSLAGTLADPFGGLADLKAGVLRVLHADSFRDDATRIWRGARYATRLRLRPDPETRARLLEGGRWLATISGERLWAEFERTAAERSPGRVLALLEQWNALQASAPGLRLHSDARRALARRRGPLPASVLLATLLAPLPAPDAICGRLAATQEAARAAREAAALVALQEATPEALAELEEASEAGRLAARWLDPPRQRALQRELRRWERTRSPLTANDLLALGVARGPALGQWLRRLRAARYLGTLRTAEAAREVVRADLGPMTPRAMEERQ